MNRNSKSINASFCEGKNFALQMVYISTLKNQLAKNR